MIGIAVIGYGYWGPNLVRNFNQTSGCSVTWICDKSEVQCQKAGKAFPQVAITHQLDEVLNDANTHAVCIALPVYAHFEVAQQALKAGKHVLLEKPMCSTVEQCDQLIALAKMKGKVLMVDHTYLYTSAFIEMKAIIDRGDIGNIQYIDGTRINLGLFQSDVNVLWDLAPHDISMSNYLMQDVPEAVQAIGIAHTDSTLENIAHLFLHYPGNRMAHFNCSWVSPVKIRQLLVGGDKKMIVFNDLESTEKIRIYDKGYQVIPAAERHNLLIDYRVGDIHIPKIPQTEALTSMAQDFRNAIQDQITPISNAKLGRDVVHILESAQQSIKLSGKLIQMH